MFKHIKVAKTYSGITDSGVAFVFGPSHLQYQTLSELVEENGDTDYFLEVLGFGEDVSKDLVFDTDSIRYVNISDREIYSSLEWRIGQNNVWVDNKKYLEEDSLNAQKIWLAELEKSIVPIHEESLNEVLSLISGIRKNWHGPIYDWLEEKGLNNILERCQEELGDQNKYLQFYLGLISSKGFSFAEQVAMFNLEEFPQEFYQVEADETYFGGDRTGADAGKFFLVPIGLCKESVEQGFTEYTDLTEENIVHYSVDETFDKLGDRLD